ncbi:MAG: hypothetical protein AUK47_16690 [Deltaproteobacteria bacterium CG2_30_63_29]|nr:MAG: hypothetical protein AUK47_16690 [Deltaproteobacteria bacterium CG2_30_63_29]
MALFQKAPRNQEEADAYGPLDVSPAEVLDYDEERWYKEIYRGDVPQLTIRAIVVGSLLGFLLAFTNLYIGLKTGWGLGVAITACIVSYALWGGLRKLGVVKTQMTILETNCMQSAASSAGYATGGTMVSAIAALLMLSATPQNPGGEHLPWLVLSLWTLFLGALGTVLAIPMKRNMINQEKLRFPSGTAAAVTLQSLYSRGSDAAKKARVLLWSALAASIFPFLIELQLLTSQVKDEVTGAFITVRGAIMPGDSKLFDWLPALGSHVVDGKTVHNQPSDWTLVMDHNPVMIAAGALVGMRVATWMLLGGLALAYVLGPMGALAEWTNTAGQVVHATSEPWKAWKEIGIWFGVPIMVVSGLLSFALQWRTIGRALKGLRNVGGGSNLVKETEVPLPWFAWGTVFSGAGVILVAHMYFEIPFFYGILGVALTFILGLVACRATGESDITPVGAMGKLMQLTYGILIPQSTTANLMTASITASSAGSAADLLNDLKSGYLLGANPRRQFMAQFIGIFSGTVATVTGFYLLVPDATALLGEGTSAPKFPAPSAQAWKAVAEVFRDGLANLHPMHQQAILWGLGVGVLIVALEQLLPKFREVLPSATGIGLGMILPFQYPLSMFLGALIAWFWTKRSPKSGEAYIVPLAAGIIAGVSIMGVIVAVLNNLVFT